MKWVKAPVMYSVGQTARFSKEKLRFSEGFEHNWTFEVFRNSKVQRRSPRPVYEFEDMRGE
jgi:hypothetical protein